ncbi:hypothetical protein H7F15_12055 [Pontibacter sp. Tf4]|uniref:Cthe_2314 family HEPN domain-containing protein n=1 Tax=Pontibacter sp. Tf4 TaxID=2761620 RepID=UPI0016252214|nr:Cthe_2314 family HEPN domain-containing protein [Pontibacter sp. Tf4]MBB6611775.1 hypothetical protein [Pontibacter sp. Tf4]
MRAESGKLIEYHEHKFVIKILKTYVEGIEKGITPISSVTREPYAYVSRINTQLIRIQHTLKSLRLARVFIAERHPFNYNEKKEKSTIQTGEYLRYHIENYFLRVTTYKDQILQLFNLVHALEIKSGLGFEKKLRKKALEHNIHAFDLIVSSVETLIAKVKPIRNKIAHEGYHSDPDLVLSEVGFQFTDDKNANESGLDRDILIDILKRTIIDNVREMMHNEKEIGANFFWILDVLYGTLVEMIESASVQGSLGSSIPS